MGNVRIWGKNGLSHSLNRSICGAEHVGRDAQPFEPPGCLYQDESYFQANTTSERALQQRESGEEDNAGAVQLHTAAVRPQRQRNVCALWSPRWRMRLIDPIPPPTPNLCCEEKPAVVSPTCAVDVPSERPASQPQREQLCNHSLLSTCHKGRHPPWPGSTATRNRPAGSYPSLPPGCTNDAVDDGWFWLDDGCGKYGEELIGYKTDNLRLRGEK